MNLNIDVFEESIDNIDLNFQYPRRGNFYENLDPFLPSETRSLKSASSPIWGHTVLLYKNSPHESLFHVCELEIYDQHDQTDIPVPTWESDWVQVNFTGADILERINHTMGTIPIYGRLLMEVLETSNGSRTKGFIYEALWTSGDMAGLGLRYSKSMVQIHANPADGTLYCTTNSNRQWTQSVPACIRAGALAFVFVIMNYRGDL